MASSLSRTLYRSLLANPRIARPLFSIQQRSFCTNNLSSTSSDDDVDVDVDDSTTLAASDAETDSLNNPPPPSSSSSSSPSPPQQRTIYDHPLENGLEVGIYKAILVGQVGQRPFQKRLKSGRTVTLLSVGTGGIRNNRRPLDNEEPRDYANRCAVQWHRVSIYPERLGEVAMKHVVPGSLLYLEGNLETKIFSDPITGLVRRIREIAIRRNGRLVFLGKGDDTQQPSQMEMIGVGYY